MYSKKRDANRKLQKKGPHIEKRTDVEEKVIGEPFCPWDVGYRIGGGSEEGLIARVGCHYKGEFCGLRRSEGFTEICHPMLGSTPYFQTAILTSVSYHVKLLYLHFIQMTDYYVLLK